MLLDNWPLLQSFGCKWSSPARWSSCSPAEAGVATGILVTAGTIIVTRVQMILQQHALYTTLARFAFVMACVMLPLLVNVRTHSLHVHHYLAAGALLPFTAFNDEVSALVQVAVFGIALDGIAVWGMDPAVIPTRVNLRASDVPTVSTRAHARAVLSRARPACATDHAREVQSMYVYVCARVCRFVGSRCWTAAQTCAARRACCTFYRPHLTHLSMSWQSARL
ncbi:MAG: hypothetical protein EOO41_05680 [Methanobacteriota archaeon]|nr:MAG: hypothetical protein EOO41_05680 [Euryarchaeota archaeon]